MPLTEHTLDEALDLLAGDPSRPWDVDLAIRHDRHGPIPDNTLDLYGRDGYAMVQLTEETVTQLVRDAIALRQLRQLINTKDTQ